MSKNPRQRKAKAKRQSLSIRNKEQLRVNLCVDMTLMQDIARTTIRSNSGQIGTLKGRTHAAHLKGFSATRIKSRGELGDHEKTYKRFSLK